MKPASSTFVELASQWSAIATALIALAGLLLAGWQIRQSRFAAREATATNLFNNTLMLSLQYPNFGHPTLSELSEQDRARYDWFVTSVLLAHEEILRVTHGDKQWRNCVKGNLAIHSDYLAQSYDEEYKFSDYYDEDLVEIVVEILSDRKNA